MSYRGKRLFDIIVAVMAMPLILISAVIFGLINRGIERVPVFFTQERSGKDGETFLIYKLCTMKPGEGEDEDRVTATGKFLRRFSIDELPQFINVLKGQMSVVGPRPTLPEQVRKYSDFQKQRLLVKPGITGLAQTQLGVSSSWEERIKLDVKYIENQSLAQDFRLVIDTLSRPKRTDSFHPKDDQIAFD